MTGRGRLHAGVGGTLAVVFVLLSSACSPAPGSSGLTSTLAAGLIASDTVSQSRDLDPYRLTFAVGPAQPMYTGVEAETEKPKHGHVTVFGGRGSIPPGLPAQGDHHVQLHVYDAVTTEVLDNAEVSSSITDPSGTETAVPVTTMQNILAGPRDFHYGNNVSMPAPGDYTVTVTVNGKRTVFRMGLGQDK